MLPLHRIPSAVDHNVLSVDKLPLVRGNKEDEIDDLEKEIHGPAMGEDLDWTDGKLVTLTESASNKYIFGKFFFADDIVMLDIGNKE